MFRVAGLPSICVSVYAGDVGNLTGGNMTEREVMTLEQVADYLQLSLRYCYKLIEQEGLPAWTMGRKWRVKKADLDVWLDAWRKGQ